MVPAAVGHHEPFSRRRFAQGGGQELAVEAVRGGRGEIPRVHHGRAPELVSVPAVHLKLEGGAGGEDALVATADAETYIHAFGYCIALLLHAVVRRESPEERVKLLILTAFTGARVVLLPGGHPARRRARRE